MKQYMKYLFALPVILLAAASCNTETKYPKQIATLDSLHKVIEIKETEFRAIDTTAFAKMSAEATEKLAYVKSNYKDTMDLQTAVLISNYHSVLKPLNTFQSKKKLVDEETAYTKKQINSLARSLEKNAIPPDSVAIYLNSEYEAGKRLLLTLDIMMNGTKTVKERFDLFGHGVDSLIIVMKQKEG